MEVTASSIGRKRYAQALIVAGIAAFLLSVTVFASSAYASDSIMLNNIYKGTRQVSMLPGQDDINNTLYFSADSYRPIEDARSSNIKVATVEVKRNKPVTYSSGYTSRGYYTLKVCFKNPGTTRVSYTYKGKRHTVTYVVHRYTNPFKHFMLDSGDYKDSFASSKLLMNGRGYQALIDEKTISGKLEIEPIDSWRVKRIYYSSIPIKPIQNGSKVDGQFCVDMENVKTGLVETFWVSPNYQVKSPVADTSSNPVNSPSLPIANLSS